MTEDNENSYSSPLDALRRYVPLAVWAIVILVILAIPLKIIGIGYLPADDALRHVAKAVSGKPWPEILVMGPAFKIDHNYGWHLLLRQIYLRSKCDPPNEARDTEKLVVFSVVALFVLVGWSALPWLKRPEAWLIALTAAALTSDVPLRFLIGRPFILTIAGLLTILFVWQAHGTSPPKWWTAVWMAALIAICTFMHGVWYLWMLPVAAFFLAGQFRWGLMLIAGWLAGAFLGASLTGHPFESPYQAVVMASRAFGMHTTQRTLVTEFQPSSGEVLGADYSGRPVDSASTGRFEGATADLQSGVLACLHLLGAQFQSVAFHGRLGLAGADGSDHMRFATAPASAISRRTLSNAWRWPADWRR